MLGNDGVCLRKDHRGPVPCFAKDAGISVEAYDCDWSSCASSWNCSYMPWPLHPRTYNNDSCVQPFMALHNAYVLAQQCGTWKPYFCNDHDDISSISCFGPLPTLTPYVKQLKIPKAVTFSSTIDFYKVHEDEIGKDIKYTISAHFDAKPRTHHFTDDHLRPTHERFRDEFQPRQTPDAHAHVLAQQPDHIQNLAITFHQQAVLDPRTQERTIKILTWFIHGQEGRECRLPRLVRLPEDFTEWDRLLTSAWRDRLHPHEAVRIFIVELEPPIAEWEEHDAQVLLVQAPQHFERAVLFTSLFHAQEQVEVQRIARFSHSEVSLSDCIEQAEVPMQVRHRLIHCFHGWRPILRPPHPAIVLPDGAAIVLHVRPEPDSPRQHDRFPFDFL